MLRMNEPPGPITQSRHWTWVGHPLVGWAVLVVLWLVWPCFRLKAAEPEIRPVPNADLLQLSLEDLGNIKVTTVSRKSESISGAPAAVYVITQEDLRHSGSASLAEALRMVPGLSVAQPNARQWAISSRGFNDTFANKLLVLMDGRTIYTPLFSGVFWEETDTVLEDVDRIEVIRGPGATLWGANAVNGVINIITKNARETQGTLISGGGGSEERAFGSVRYGGRLGSNAYYRVYAKYANRDEYTQIGGGGVGDDFWTSQEGFRIDWQPAEINRVTLQGDYHYDDFGGRFFSLPADQMPLVPVNRRFSAEGGNLLGRWTHEFSGESELTTQVAYDRTDRGFGIAAEVRDTVDFDAQHRVRVGDRNEVVWGGGYRYSVDRISETPDLRTLDPRVGLQIFSAFVQDEIVVVPDRLHLTLGTKLEHNDYTGFEVQPSARFAWTPHERHTFWAAASRAVRTPSRAERDFRLYVDPAALLAGLPLPTLVSIDGNPEFGSENLLAYEIGYRVSPHRRLSLDGAAFYNDYDRLRSQVAKSFEFQPAPFPHLVVPTTINNNLYGESYGFEVLATWQALDVWRWRASYSFLSLQLHNRESGIVSITEMEEFASPTHQVFVSTDVALGRQVELGLGFRYVDRLKVQTIPAYVELEARLAWKPTPNCELAIIGRNLIDSHHREFSAELLTYRRVEVDRAVYGKLTLRF